MKRYQNGAVLEEAGCSGIFLFLFVFPLFSPPVSFPFLGLELVHRRTGERKIPKFCYWAFYFLFLGYPMENNAADTPSLEYGFTMSVG